LAEHCRWIPNIGVPVRSFLAVPLVLRSSEIFAGLFLGHERSAHFTERLERLMERMASHASIAIENARLLEGAQQEIESRRRTEEWLNFSEARFRDFAEVGSDALWETDADFRITSYAHSPMNVLGIPLADVIGKTSWEIAGADSTGAEWKEHIEDQRARRPFSGFEFKIAGQDGKLRWISSNGRPFFDAKGNFLGYRGVASNITARKEAEAKLNQSATQQQAVATISQYALQPVPTDRISKVAADLIARTLSAEIVSILELSADKQVLRLIAEVGWPPMTAEPRAIPLPVCRPLHQALNSSDAVLFSGPDFNIVPDARHRPGHGVAIAMGDKSDRFGVLAVCRSDSHGFDTSDVNFLQSIAFVLAAVAEQRKSEAVLRLRDRALEALDQGIMISDAGRLDNPLIYVNPAFRRVTGYSTEEAIGKNARLLQGPETNKEAISAIRAAVEREESYRGTILNFRKDGTSFWNDLTVSPVRDAGGTTSHFVGILSDISERIELEAQFRQAQKMEAVGHLTGGIAHDFNNLLAVILGNSEILFEELTDPELKGIAQLVMETAEHGAELTQGLLAFGRRQALCPEVVSLGEAIADFSSVLRRTLGEHVVLDIVATDAGKEAMVDLALFESAILNLAVNARDAMPEGGLLTIETRVARSPSAEVPAELAPGDYIKVSVRDTGSGMTSAVLERVFEPFFTTKEVGKGTGLGLPMVYGFATQSGGHVAIDSAPGFRRRRPAPQAKPPPPPFRYRCRLDAKRSWSSRTSRKSGHS
jgi:PAS domain S-box-containing protein